ncbi:MAG: hypothetical protein AB1847_12250, partial [bacterium]
MAKIKNAWWSKVLGYSFLMFFTMAVGVGFMGIREGKTNTGVNLALDGQAIYPQSVDQEVPEIYENKVVWMQQGSDYYYKVFLGDLETGNSRQLGQSTAAEKYPSIWENKVIWMDYRSIMDDPAVQDKYAYIFKYYDIYAYDLEENREFPICTNPAWQGYGDLQKDRAVYADMRTGSPDIFLYDMRIGQEFAICLNPGWQGNPVIYDNYIVWMDERSGNYDIYGFDLTRGQEFCICAAADNQAYPAISGTKVVWQDKRNGTDDIYAYDLATRQEIPVCIHEGKQQVPDIYGNIVVWQDDRNGNWDIYGYDLTTGEEFQITDQESDQTFPAIFKNRVVWIDSRSGHKNVYAASLPASFTPASIDHVRNRNSTAGQDTANGSGQDAASGSRSVTASGNGSVARNGQDMSTSTEVLTVGPVEANGSGATNGSGPTATNGSGPAARNGQAMSISADVLISAPSIVRYENSGCKNELKIDDRAFEEEKFSASYENGILYLFHENAIYNCCIEEITVTMEMVNNTINIYEDEKLEGSGCKCLCPYDISTQIACLQPGTYVVQFFNKQTGNLLGTIRNVIIPGTVCPLPSSIPEQVCCPIPCVAPDLRCCPLSSADPDQRCKPIVCPVACPVAVASTPVQLCCPCTYEDDMESDTWVFIQGASTLSSVPPPIQKIDYSSNNFVSPKRSIWAYLASYLEKTVDTRAYTTDIASISDIKISPIAATTITATAIAKDLAKVSAYRKFELCGCENLRFKLRYFIRQNMSSRSSYRRVCVEVVAFDAAGQSMGQHTYILFQNPSQELGADTTSIQPVTLDKWATLGRSLEEDMPIQWCAVKTLKVILTATGDFPAGQSDLLEVFWDDLSIQGKNCEIVQLCTPCPISNTDPKGLCCPYPSADPTYYCKPCPVPNTTPYIFCKPCPISDIDPKGLCCPYSSADPASYCKPCPLPNTTPYIFCKPCPISDIDPKGLCCPYSSADPASYCKPCPVTSTSPNQLCTPCPISNTDPKGLCCPYSAADPVSYCKPYCPVPVEPVPDECIVGVVEAIQHHASAGRSDLKLVDSE